MPKLNVVIVFNIFLEVTKSRVLQLYHSHKTAYLSEWASQRERGAMDAAINTCTVAHHFPNSLFRFEYIIWKSRLKIANGVWLKPAEK